jgi:hypothetical protein
MWGLVLKLGKGVLGAFTGGTLDKILETIDRRMDSDVEKDRIKAEVTKTYVNAQANLLVGRTWWFQLFFVIPLGFWWTAVIADSVFGWEHNIAALPSPLDDWAALIIGALFVVDGTKAVIGRFKN